MKKIIISESAEKYLMQSLINEELCGWSDKVNLVKKDLDAHYIKADEDCKDKFGDVTTRKIVIVLDSRKQPTTERLTLDALFDKLQYKYQTLFGDTKERDSFLKQAIDDWYDNKITKSGNLSKY